MATDWSKLPQDLLGSIASKLYKISDYLRFNAVCTSWRSSTSNCNINRLREQHPWILDQHPLILDQFDSDTGEFVFSCFSKRKLHHINLIQVRGYHIVASNYGWLILQGSNVFLLNPLTEAQILLPDLPFEKSSMHSAYISSDPLSDDCVIICMVNESYSRTFLSCKPGGNAWTSIYTDHLEDVWGECHCQIIFCKGNAHLICCSLNVMVCNIGTPQETRCFIPFKFGSSRGIFEYYSFFETPSGELVVVEYNFVQHVRISRILKAGFDQTEIMWTRVKDIGDAVVFASNNKCTCFHASDYPLLKRNHIYMAVDDYLGDMMAYDIANGSAVIYEGLGSKSDAGSPISRLSDSSWFFPSLSKGI